MTADLITIQEKLTAIAREAGDILLQYFDHAHITHTKSSSADLVTDADTASEQFIVQALQDSFPRSHIVGEEGGGMGAPADEADYFWYVDPLDGTVNFAHNVPHFSVSLALADRAMQPLVGLVYNPITHETFAGTRGNGAYVNGKPMHVSDRDSLNQAMLVSGFPYDKWSNPDNNLREWAAFTVRARGMRRTGSAALDLCYVAAGRYDGMWERNLQSWDCMAGALFVLEAGGRVSDYHGQQPDDLYTSRYLVASNGLIHDAMIRVITEARAGG